MCLQQYQGDQPMEFYCEDCKVLICLKCSLVRHNRHTITETQKAAQESKMQMEDAVTKVKAEIVRYEGEIKKQTDLKTKNKIEIMNAEKKMTDTVEKLIRDLQEHEKKMKDKFREIYEAQDKHYATRLENFELVLTQLKSCVERVESQECTEVDERKETHLVIVTKDSDGLQCYQEEDKVEVYILTSGGDRRKTDIIDAKDGKYTVTYTPQCGRQNGVTILVNGERLTGSPWILPVDPHQYQFSFQFGSKGKGRGEFDDIYDIDVSQRTGTIAVAERGNQRIQLFSSEGKFQREIRLDSGVFSVAFTDSGDVLTLVPKSGTKLRLFSEEGQFIKHINDSILLNQHSFPLLLMVV
ncbi:E3 ubiquitin-protein ligase TRIM71-like [Montipora foliosa]|uniref:E3 ubiquitin-protein ligase TRIM71-like n=1 Tax=Montipora foliosa TaxID=591990 RepID=UPI0035F1050C